MKKLILTLIIGLAFTIPVFANGDDDKTDRLTSGQNYTFSPGYLNAAKQKTEAILRQESPKKSLYDRAVEYVQSKLGKDVTDKAYDKVTPELQKRASSVGGETAESLLESDVSFIDSSQQNNVNIGAGTDQRYENGRLISEVIDGRRYVYAGFTNVGKSTIQDAIKISSKGDMVIVKSGTYNVYNTDGINRGLRLKDGVSLFGGYSEDGTRNIIATPTIIEGTVKAWYISNPTTIDGFILDSRHYSIQNTSLEVYISRNLAISNNIFYGFDGALVTASKNIYITNNSFYTRANGINVSWSASAVYRSTGGAGYSSTVYSRNNNFYYCYLPGGSGITVKNSGYVSSRNDYFSVYNDRNTAYYDSSSVSTYNPSVTANQTTTGVPITRYTKAYTRVTSDNILYGPLSRTNSKDYTLSKDAFSKITSDKSIDANTLTAVFKGLLANENLLSQGAAAPIDPAMLARLVRGALNESALSIPGGDINTQEMSIAMALANILKNPTEDQKVLIDAIKGLIQDMNNVENEGEKGADPELKKQTDNLIQMVANLLVAQAVPDLFKEGDIQGIKGIFNELNASKTDIMRKYALSTAPYYDKLKRDIEKNVNALQLNNIISNTISDEELKNMPRSDIDRIMEKLKKLDKRSFEADYILQQESKYRKEYMDPNKKNFEGDMKALLQDVTTKLNMALEAVPRKK